jgi:hypothetical protein
MARYISGWREQKQVVAVSFRIPGKAQFVLSIQIRIRHPFLIHQRELLPSQCSDIINSILSYANYTWISLQPPFCILW